MFVLLVLSYTVDSPLYVLTLCFRNPIEWWLLNFDSGKLADMANFRLACGTGFQFMLFGFPVSLTKFSHGVGILLIIGVMAIVMIGHNEILNREEYYETKVWAKLEGIDGGEEGVLERIIGEVRQRLQDWLRDESFNPGLDTIAEHIEQCPDISMGQEIAILISKLDGLSEKEQIAAIERMRGLLAGAEIEVKQRINMEIEIFRQMYRREKKVVWYRAGVCILNTQLDSREGLNLPLLRQAYNGILFSGNFSYGQLIEKMGIADEFRQMFNYTYQRYAGNFLFTSRWFGFKQHVLMRDICGYFNIDTKQIEIKKEAGYLLMSTGKSKEDILAMLGNGRVWNLVEFRQQILQYLPWGTTYVEMIVGLDIVEEFSLRLRENYFRTKGNLTALGRCFGFNKHAAGNTRLLLDRFYPCWKEIEKFDKETGWLLPIVHKTKTDILRILGREFNLFQLKEMFKTEFLDPRLNFKQVITGFDIVDEVIKGTILRYYLFGGNLREVGVSFGFKRSYASSYMAEIVEWLGIDFDDIYFCRGYLLRIIHKQKADIIDILKEKQGNIVMLRNMFVAENIEPVGANFMRLVNARKIPVC